MNKDNNKNMVIALLVVIIVILLALIIILVTNTGNLNTTSNSVNNELNENIIDNDVNNNTDNNNQIYSEESFIGCYQLLNFDFDVSKYDSTQNSLISYEIQLLEDGTAKIAYELNDNGNITSNQYNATYTLVSTLDEEIDGDHYKTLKLSYNSTDIENDSIISSISTDITYNPAINPSDSQSYPKSLVMKGGAGNMILYMVTNGELKYLK